MTHSTHRGNRRVPVFSLGERIRKVREDLGLSQQQFADKLIVDRKTVGNWEGERTQPRNRDLMMISSVADVSLEWLAGELFPPIAGREEAIGAGGAVRRDSDNSRGAGRDTDRLVPAA